MRGVGTPATAAIDLARRARAEGLGQRAGDPVRARQQQHARSILVQPVNQLGPVLEAKGQRAAQPVDMTVALPAASLTGQARRLVQRDDMLILPKHRALDHLFIGIGNARGLVPRQRGAGIGQGRHAHLLPGLDPRGRLDATAIDAQLARAAHLLDCALTQLRKAFLQPAVQPLTTVIFIDPDGLHMAHDQIPLPIASPAITAASDRMTEQNTYTNAPPV